MTKKESIIILFSITLCWSSAYIFIKDIPAEFSIYSYLTLTSGVAGLILLFLMRKRLKRIDRMTFIRGLILALLIMGNMIFEKFGLDNLSASAVSTIASMNIVIVPIILVFLKQFPSRNQTVGIAIILCGIIISNHIAFTGSDSANLRGTIFVLLSCVMMSLYTVLAADYTKKSDPLILTMLQMCLTAVFGLVLWLITDPASITSINWSGEVISYILIIAFFSKCYAYLMLMLAEKYADALSVTIVASMDPVVTLLMAIVIPDTVGSTETFSARSLLGALIIAIGAIVAGTNFLNKKKAAEKSVAGKAEEALTETAATKAALAEEALTETAATKAALAEAALTEAVVTEAVVPEAAETEAVVTETAATVMVRDGFSRSKDEKTALAENKVREGFDNVRDNGSALEEQPVQEGFFSSNRLPSPVRTFFTIVVMFAVLSASINVMKFAAGYSEARPVNALPAVAGMLFGPVGAAACALGNVLGDFPSLSRYGLTLVLGLAGNFLVAYIPYKIWYAVTDKEVNMHSWKNILLFLWAAFTGSMACSCVLGYGLEMLYGEWQNELIRISFLNNFGFTVALGLPSLIVLTSDDVRWGGWKRRFLDGKKIFGVFGNGKGSWKKTRIPLWGLCVVYTAVVGALFLTGINGVQMQHNVSIMLLAVAAAVCTVGMCLMPEKNRVG